MICEDCDDKTGGTGTEGHDCNTKPFNPIYMMIWMIITMMMTIIDECVGVQPLQTILYILQEDGLLTT